MGVKTRAANKPFFNLHIRHKRFGNAPGLRHNFGANAVTRQQKKGLFHFDFTMIELTRAANQGRRITRYRVQRAMASPLSIHRRTVRDAGRAGALPVIVC
jgi:hypothetical protein